MNCVKCGLALSQGDRVCPHCGTARELTSEDFQELQEKTERLLAEYRSGALTEDDFHARLEGLILSDPAGVHWKFDPESGAWSCYRAGRWQSALPAHLQGSAPPPVSSPLPALASIPLQIQTAVPASPKRRSPRWVLPVVLGGALLLLGYIVFAWFMSGYQESQLQGEILEVAGVDDDPWTMALTDEQVAMREYRGAPEAFTILFFQEEQEDGSILDVRLETWTYFSDDTECTFYNGSLISEEVLLDHPGNILPTPYLPEQFPYRLSALEVAQAAGVDEYLQVPLDEEFLENGRVFYASGLSWGVTGERLTFVQALALQGEVTP